MDIVLIILFILLCLCIVALFFSMYLAHRNGQVRDFCIHLVDMAYEYELRRIKETEPRKTENAYNWFVHKYSYDNFLYSLKPLKLENWYTEEELKEINR